MSLRFERAPDDLKISELLKKERTVEVCQTFQSLHLYAFYTREAGRRQSYVESD